MSGLSWGLRQRVYKTDLKRLRQEIEVFRKKQHRLIEDEIQRRFGPRVAALQLLLKDGSQKTEPPQKTISRIPKSASQILRALGEKIQRFSKKDVVEALTAAGEHFTDKSIEHGLYWLKANQFIEWETPARGPVPGVYQKGPMLSSLRPETRP